MARVDFYVLPATGDAARQRFACRLAEKAYRQKNTVHIQVSDEQTARLMDELLWTFRDGSFLPHEVIDNNGAIADSPVTVGTVTGKEETPDLLINLAETLPSNVESFSRIAEIVTSDDRGKSRGREHFARYRDAGHVLETHKM